MVTLIVVMGCGSLVGQQRAVGDSRQPAAQ